MLSYAGVICWVLTVSEAVGAGIPSGGRVLGPAMPGEAAGTLLGRLDLRYAEDAPIEVVATDPSSGISLGQKAQRLSSSGAVRIDSRVTNTGDKSADVGSVVVGRWNFRLAEGGGAWRYQPLTHRNDVWHGSTYWTGPDWTRVGKDWHHSGEKASSVRRFTAPRDGQVAISGRVYKADTNNGGGDGVRLEIRHKNRTLWQAEIKGDDAKGVEPKLSFDVRRDDPIRFLVHKRSDIGYDTTHWDPVITYSDGARYQASAGFSTTDQGKDGWSYEMEPYAQAERRLPRLRGFGLEMGLREMGVAPGEPVCLTNRDALPCVILSEGSDQSGMILGMPPVGNWEVRCSLSEEDVLGLEVRVGDDKAPLRVASRERITLPHMIVGAYRGKWLKGVGVLQRLVEPSESQNKAAGLEGLKRLIGEAFGRVGPMGGSVPPLDLCALVQADWWQQDRLTDTPESYRAAMKAHLDKTRRLLVDLSRLDGASDKGAADTRCAGLRAALEKIAASVEGAGTNLEESRRLYLQLRWLKRQISLSNPLFGFGPMLFCKRVPTSYSHLVMQYYGWRARPGGGLFVLERPGYSLAVRDILAGQLANGNTLEPRLSFDAGRIVFSYVRCREEAMDYQPLLNDKDEGFYHVWEVNVDGSGLRQLSSGPYDDLMPTYLPDGGIAFCSTRRKGYARCFGAQFSRRWHVYTLHRMDGDGGDIRTLSYHDTNEWFPTVSNTGLIVYARWDYIDRDAVTHQNLWSSRPDGTNPITVWGNATPTPHCAFQSQQIPGSNKFVFTASAHHSITAGSIVVVDPTVANNGEPALTRITPEVPFPEAEGMDIREYYTAPWPLSEKYFLVAYSPKPLIWEPGANDRDALGIYLLDAFGNRELIYRDVEIGCTNPCPLVARAMPPIVPPSIRRGENSEGEMLLTDIYRGLSPVPRGSVHSLRIVQIFPKTTHVAGTPPIGAAGEENARAVLGTVPVEADGSARFKVPAGKPLLFQALDKDGFAIQTMRTVTYVQPGERVSCAGCHESRMSAPVRTTAMAARRVPSRIEPGPWDGQPFSYVRMVQPVLDKHCIGCHDGQHESKGQKTRDLRGSPDRGYTRSYWSLCGGVDFWGAGTNPKNASTALVPRFGARNQVQITPPGGAYGALGSRLMKMLRGGHHDVKLSDEDIRRLAMWIDLNAVFYGVNLPEEQAKQLRGEVVAMPDIQ